jgi:hypothetical protein
MCLGRRNWLYCGSDRSGRAAAIHFSLIASRKRHGLDPWTWLRDMLIRLPPSCPPATQIPSSPCFRIAGSPPDSPR